MLLGDGKEKANLQARAVALDLTNVLFLPPVPKNEMGAVLAGAAGTGRFHVGEHGATCPADSRRRDEISAPSSADRYS